MACYDADTTWKNEGDYTGFVCLCKGSKMSDLSTLPPYYRIYLLTVWQEQNRSPPERITWRFRLEDPRTGRQQAFADAATFMAALWAMVTTPATPNKQEEEEE